MALTNLGVNMRHAFSCDVCPHVKTTIEANFPPNVFYDDLTKRDNSTAPKADIYIAGFPCQSFSSAGKQQGFEDTLGRGQIFWYVRDYLQQQSPRVFVLENVKGLASTKGGGCLHAILDSLEGLGCYNIYHQLLNTKEHGIPQSRARMYFVGIKKSHDDKTFAFPAALPADKRPSIEAFLDPRLGRPSRQDLPPKSSSTARKNVIQVLKDIERTKDSDPLKEPWIIDIDSSPHWANKSLGLMPCMTRSRGAGHWVTNRGRRVNKHEMMRLQGINPNTFKVAVSNTQLGRQIGNSMSVNILERLFCRILPAAQLVPHGSLFDRWESGKPPASLTSVRAKRAADSVAAGSRKRARA